MIAVEETVSFANALRMPMIITYWIALVSLIIFVAGASASLF